MERDTEDGGGGLGFTYSNTWILKTRHAELVSASIYQLRPKGLEARWTLKQVQGDDVIGR
jgi:hypothetical protein